MPLREADSPDRHDPAGLTDAQAMRLAIDQAHAARAAGEVPVGAVLVRDGRVLATGANAPVRTRDPTAHAEIVALRAAADALGNYRLDGCTLYVTLEPCPMCAGAMLHARLARVVFGAADPRTGAAGSVCDLFGDRRLNHRTAVEGGVLASECAALLHDFFQERRSHQARAAQPLREDALRTPAAAFADPRAAAWEGAYTAEVPALEGLRMHYVERGGSGASIDGVADGTTFVCLHGTADWGVRFAALADALAGQGARVLVPDLIGFGRSDKPKRAEFHRLDWHVRALGDWLRGLALQRVVIVSDAADPALALAVASVLGAANRGVMLVSGLDTGPNGATLAAAPYPDRGHAAALRAFASGWRRGAGDAADAMQRTLRIDLRLPDAGRRAVEYFRA